MRIAVVLLACLATWAAFLGADVARADGTLFYAPGAGPRFYAPGAGPRRGPWAPMVRGMPRPMIFGRSRRPFFGGVPPRPVFGMPPRRFFGGAPRPFGGPPGPFVGAPPRPDSRQFEAPRGRVCFNPAETRDKIAAHRLAEPFRAFRTGQLQGEALRARLCRWNPDEFVYEVSVLRRDGRIVHVYVNAQNGQGVDIRDLH